MIVRLPKQEGGLDIVYILQFSSVFTEHLNLRHGVGDVNLSMYYECACTYTKVGKFILCTCQCVSYN